MDNKDDSFIAKNKTLLTLSLLNFIIIYGSSFVPGYEYFIDELYYIACANHLAFGYIDHPPLAPFILAVWKFIFGTSVYSIRLLPALAGSATVFFAGVIAREMGGGKTAQLFAAAALMCTPVLAALSSFYSMNVFEPLLAVLMLYYLVRIVKENDNKKWIALGVLMGLGMMNKHTFGLYILALLIALLVTGKWRLIFNRWFVFGGLIAFAIFLPNIIWQVVNGFPSLKFYAIISKYKNVYTPPLQFFMGQIITTSPFTLIIWLAGLFYLLFTKKMKDYRFLSIMYLLIIIFVMSTGSSRPDRTALIYPAVLIGGSVFWDSLIGKYKLVWVKPVMLFFLFLGLAATIPIFLPCLTYEQDASYIKAIGFNTEMERGNSSLLTQMLADRIGWKEKADMMNSAYQTLSDSEKARTILSATNYGQAGALDLYGKKFGFPKVICGHNSYSLWNREHLDADIVLYLAHKNDTAEVRERFANFKIYPEIFTNPYVTPHENNLVVYICRDPLLPLDTLRDKGKFYY